MLGLTTLSNAVRNLASALDGLAHTVRTADAALQQQLLLKGPEADAPALPGPGATGAEADGGDAGGDGADAQPQGSPAPARRNGRRRAAASTD